MDDNILGMFLTCIIAKAYLFVSTSAQKEVRHMKQSAQVAQFF